MTYPVEKKWKIYEPYFIRSECKLILYFVEVFCSESAVNAATNKISRRCHWAACSSLWACVCAYFFLILSIFRLLFVSICYGGEHQTIYRWEKILYVPESTWKLFLRSMNFDCVCKMRCLDGGWCVLYWKLVWRHTELSFVSDSIQYSLAFFFVFSIFLSISFFFFIHPMNTKSLIIQRAQMLCTKDVKNWGMKSTIGTMYWSVFFACHAPNDLIQYRIWQFRVSKVKTYW